MDHNDIRWKQRFQNFEKSLLQLEEVLKINNPDVFQRAGMIQFFEMTFELAWNVMKDYLEDQGVTDVKFPRTAIKKAFETGLIKDGHNWLAALEDRNLTSHAYDEKTAAAIEKLIRNSYYQLLKDLHSDFAGKLKS